MLTRRRTEVSMGPMTAGPSRRRFLQVLAASPLMASGGLAAAFTEPQAAG